MFEWLQYTIVPSGLSLTTIIIFLLLHIMLNDLRVTTITVRLTHAQYEIIICLCDFFFIFFLILTL